jgi:ribonuclease T2
VCRGWEPRSRVAYLVLICSRLVMRALQLAGVVDHLNKKWGTLACTSKHNEGFWEHEWSKHGTCSGFTQRRYFEASLELYNRYDITRGLGNAGVVADDRFYPVANITSALTELLGYAPQIECNKDPEGNRQLHQVYVCVAKDATTVIECPASIRNPCRGEVQFPLYGSVPSRHTVSAVEVQAPKVTVTEFSDSEL